MTRKLSGIPRCERGPEAILEGVGNGKCGLLSYGTKHGFHGIPRKGSLKVASR